MNKAIILAGGFGTRLSPLTDSLPKPLMTINGTTLCEHIISQLVSSGINEIMISVGYRGQMIMNKIGNSYKSANIRYLEETLPLGTAGGLKYAKNILNLCDNEPLLIISGDCVCDFDIRDIAEHHKNHNADATIVTVEYEEPLEYGVVLSDSGGLICGFNEKPPWSQVNCNCVNTGIYVINSNCADSIPQGAYDFSKDLFPKMLKERKKLSEYRAQGYWCDIGSIESYYKSCIDSMNGKIRNFEFSDCADFGKLENTGVKIFTPCYIHKSCEIESGAVIGPNTSLGENCRVGKNSRVSGSIVHNNCTISEGCKIQGAVMCSSSIIEKDCTIGGGTVIACNNHIPQNSIYGCNSKIDQNDENNCTFSYSKKLCMEECGISLGETANFNANVCEKIGRSVSAASGKHARIGVMHDGSPFSYLYAKSLITGIEHAGVMSYDLSAGFEELAKYSACHFTTDCFLYVSETNKKINCRIYNKNGLPPSHDYERRLIKAYSDIDKVYSEKLPLPCVKITNSENSYICALSDNARAYTSENGYSGLKASFEGRTDSRAFSLLKKVFLDMGGTYTEPETCRDMSLPVIHFSEKDGIRICQSNYALDKYHMAREIIKEQHRRGVNNFVLPFISPSAYRECCGDSNILNHPEFSGKRFNIPRELLDSCYWIYDDMILCARFMSLLLRDKKNLSEYCLGSAPFAFYERTVVMPAGTSKTDAIRNIAKNHIEQTHQDSYEGIKLRYPGGAVTVVPGKAQTFKIYSEAVNTEAAKDLCDETCRALFENVANCNYN